MTPTDPLQSHDIGNIGESLVRLFFQKWQWHPRKDEDDQGIDFSVEVPQEIRRRFLVQVKTSNPVNVLADGQWSIQIEQNALRKYRATREPVVVVAVDLPTNELRFLHIQRWIDDRNHALDGDRNSELSIRFDASAKFGFNDKEAFWEAVLEAWAYQDAKHYPAPLDIERKERELSELDRRLRLEITASKKGYTYSISAIGAPVETLLTMKPSTAGDMEELSRAYKFGSPVNFRVDDLSLAGSPLLEQMPRGAGEVELLGLPTSVRIRFGRLHRKKKRNTLRKIAEAAGAMTKGAHGAEIRTQDGSFPLNFAFRTDFIAQEAKLDLSFHPDRLLGLPLIALGVKRVHELLTAGLENDLAVQVIFFDKISPGPLPLRRTESLAGGVNAYAILASQIECLLGLEAAAQFGQSDLNFGPIDGIVHDEEEDWRNAWQLFSTGRCLIGPQRINVAAASPEVFLLAQRNAGLFVLRGSEYEVRAWGEVVCRVPVVLEFEGYKLRKIDDTTAAIEPGDHATAMMRHDKSRPPNPGSSINVASPAA